MAHDAINAPTKQSRGQAIDPIIAVRVTVAGLSTFAFVHPAALALAAGRVSAGAAELFVCKARWMARRASAMLKGLVRHGAPLCSRKARVAGSSVSPVKKMMSEQRWGRWRSRSR